MKTANIKIEYDGGERLYIHPISFDWNNLRNNKVHYFISPEFPPYEAEFYIFNDTLWELTKPLGISRLWHGIIKRYLVALARLRFWFYKGWWKDIFGKYFKFYNHLWRGLIWQYKVGMPFLAIDVYNGWFSVPGQLVIVDPDHLTENYYLIPSQEYLKQRVTEYLQKKPEDDYEKEHQTNLSSWVMEQLSKGLKVIYLCSLDT